MAPSGDLRWSLLAILATGLLSVCPTGVLAQTTTAVCLSSFDWMNNSKGQNPCLVAAYLQGACNGGQFTVDALPLNTHYTGPYADDQNECQCSSVTYSTISACGLCQNRTIITWSSWDYNCTTVYPAAFPLAIPDGTAVPEWAYQNVETSDVFNVTLAQSVGDSPESTATHVQSTASLVSTTTSTVLASLTSSSISSPSATPTNTASSTQSLNTGAIAGGVVGGVVGVALIVGAIVYFVMRHKRSQVPPPAQFSGIPPSTSYPTTAYAESTPLSPSLMAQPRLYDPSDPSTFPTSPPPPTVLTGSSNNYQNPSINYSTTSARPGGYSGAPEV